MGLCTIAPRASSSVKKTADSPLLMICLEVQTVSSNQTLGDERRIRLYPRDSLDHCTSLPVRVENAGLRGRPWLQLLRSEQDVGVKLQNQQM